MAPLRTGARDDGAVEFATPDPSLPRNDSRARLIPELMSRNISSFRTDRVEIAGKSLGKPIILEPAPMVQETAHDRRDSPSSGGASIASCGLHTLLASATDRLLYSPRLIQARGRWL